MVVISTKTKAAPIIMVVVITQGEILITVTHHTENMAVVEMVVLVVILQYRIYPLLMDLEIHQILE